MRVWFLLAGNDPEELKSSFIKFYSSHSLPRGIALWKWKRTCWICSPKSFEHQILTAFDNFGAIEFSSAPSPEDLEFIYGDERSLAVHS